VVNFTPWLLYPPWERTLVPIEKEAAWTPEPVWAVLEKRKFSYSYQDFNRELFSQQHSRQIDYATPALKYGTII